LWVPGSGTDAPFDQLHDLNGGVLPSGLFWTVALSRAQVRFSMSDQRAVMQVRGLPLIDTFSFFSPHDTPATADFRVEWRATGPALARGSGSEVAPDDPAAWLGEIAPSLSTFTCSASEIGFDFECHDGSSAPLGYAQIGHERNGVFLT
jgi:hypothetical protein